MEDLYDFVRGIIWHNSFNNEVGIPMEMVLPCLDCPKPAGANYFCHSSQETKANALDMTWGDHQRLDELDLCIFGLSEIVILQL